MRVLDVGCKESSIRYIRLCFIYTAEARHQKALLITGGEQLGTTRAQPRSSHREE